jgi:hypothetical protein
MATLLGELLKGDFRPVAWGEGRKVQEEGLDRFRAQSGNVLHCSRFDRQTFSQTPVETFLSAKDNIRSPLGATSTIEEILR